MYNVVIKNKVLKSVSNMPKEQQIRFALLVDSLKNDGPFRTEFPNYNPLGENEFHCHLSHKWVACWKWVKDTILIEVYYAGSRENAPY